MVVLEAESADEWEDVVSNCFIPLSCVAFQTGFHGRMDHLPLGGRISVSTVSTDGTTVERSERLAGRATTDDIHLSLQVASRGTVRQGRRMVAVRPGSITMYATDSAYYQDYSEPGQKQLIVQVSRDALGFSRAAISDALARLEMPRTDASRVFFSYVAGLQKRAKQSGGETPVNAAATAKDLAVTMIRTAASGRRIVPRTPTGLLYSMEDFINTNLANVSVDDIASEFFVSRRTLYDVFESLETTPGEFLRRKRLSVAAARLIDPQHADVAIGEVAAGAGFKDATTFGRAFRREFGMTPRSWRKNAERRSFAA